MTQDMIQEKQKPAAISSGLMRHIYLSLYLSPPAQPSPSYQMSGLEFLLICGGRSRANICFIFHSFGWSSSVTPPRGAWETGGSNRRRTHVIIYHFYGRVSSVRHFLKIIPSTWSFPVMGSWAGLPGTVIINFNWDRNYQQQNVAIFLLYLLALVSR